MSPRRSLSFPKAMFLVLGDRRSSQEGQLLRDLLCGTEDERQSCLDHPMVTTIGVCSTGSDYKYAPYFFHGAFGIVMEDTNLILFKGEDAPRPLADRVERFARKYTSKKITIVDAKDYEPPGISKEIRGYFSPLV